MAGEEPGSQGAETHAAEGCSEPKGTMPLDHMEYLKNARQGTAYQEDDDGWDILPFFVKEKTECGQLSYRLDGHTAILRGVLCTAVPPSEQVILRNKEGEPVRLAREWKPMLEESNTLAEALLLQKTGLGFTRDEDASDAPRITKYFTRKPKK